MVEKNGWGEWYRLNVWVYPQIHMLKPKSQYDVLGGGAFGRSLHGEGGSLMNGISALLKETPESSLTPSAILDMLRKWPSMHQEKGLHQMQNLQA